MNLSKVLGLLTDFSGLLDLKKVAVVISQLKISHIKTPLTVLYTLRKTHEMSHQVANEKFMMTDQENKQKPYVGLREI